ncbi:MAG: hypothetical protein WD852_06585 [Methyloceanibacter sp.]
MASKNPFEQLLSEFTKDSDEANYAEFGWFITAFAHAEAAVHMLARRLSGMSDEKARAVFGGLKLADLMDRVSAMMRIDKADAASIEEVKACFQQFRLIGERRNKLVHRSTHFESHFIVTNALTSKSLPAEVDFVHINELKAMHNDCLAIFIRLRSVPALSQKLKRVVSEVKNSAWRYKPAVKKFTKANKRVELPRSDKVSSRPPRASQKKRGK